MIRLLIPVLIAVAVVWLIARLVAWARRANLKVGFHRMPNPREMAVLTAFGQVIRFLLRLLLRR